MKIKILLAALVLSAFLGAKAQSPILLTDDTISIGSSTMPGFSVLIPEVEYNETLKAWTKLLETGTRSKAVQDNETISIFGARIKDVSDNPVNVYSKLINLDSAVNLQTAIELSKDEYAGNAERADVRDYIFGFAKEQYLSLANQELKDEEKKLRDLERDLGSLEKDKSKMEESIRKNNELISTERERLITLNNELNALSPGMGSADTISSDSDEYKDREKQIKQKSRDIRSSEKKISNAEKEIEQAERSIPQNVDQQVDARGRVSEQEAVVKRYEQKVETIKNYRQ